MSAQADFEAWLKKWDAGHAPRTYELLDALLKEHAHGLAEKIRNSEELRDATDDHMFDCFMAADLIDPEVSSNG